MAKKSYAVKVHEKYCKGCGLCVRLCPGKPERVFDKDENGKAVAVRPENCIGCRSCELHCPDFCVEVTEQEDASHA